MGIVKERSFPRGGRKPPSKSDKTKKIKLFDIRGKKKKEKKLKKLKEAPKEIIKAEPLTYNTLTDGMLLLGCVITISDYYIRLSLPGRLIGKVSMTNISAPYTKILKSLLEKKNVDENYYELKNMFKVGQFVVAKVLTNTVSPNGRRKVELTLDPSCVNVNYIHSSLTTGTVLHGAVKSIEDHGYMIDFGIKSLRAFLKTKAAQKFIDQWNDGRPLGIGQLLPCLIQKTESSSGSSVVQVTADPVATSSTFANIEQKLSIHTLTPGTLVKSLVTESIQDGFIIEFLNFKGFVYRDHVGDPAPTVAKMKYARVLYTVPLLNTVYLSMFLGSRDLLAAPKVDEPGEPVVGKVIKHAKVVTASKKGVWVSLGKYEKCRGFIMRNKLKDGIGVAPEKVKELYPIDKELSVRICRREIMENIFLCSARKSDVQGDIYTHEDVKAGMKVTGEVIGLVEKGLEVKLGKNCLGFVPLSHLADFPLKFPEKRFTKGKTVTARVMKVIAEKGNVLLTLKQSLIKSELPVITSYEEAANATFADGVISKISEKGLAVRFYNEVKGFVSISQTGCSSSDLKDMKESYFEGQVVKCRIIHCKPEKKKLFLSLLLDKKSDIINCPPEILSRIGHVYSLKVDEVTADSLAVEVIGSNVENESVLKGKKGFVPALHLTDNIVLASCLLKTYNAGDEIASAVLHSVQASNLQPVFIFSLRPAVLQFCSSISEKNADDEIESDESEDEENEKTVEDANTYEVKVGDVLPCSVLEITENALFVEAPIPIYGRKIIVFRENVANDEPEKIEDLGFVKNQLIFGKVIRKDDMKKRLVVSTKLSNFWDGYDLEPSLELVKSYLTDIEHIQNKVKAANLPLKKFVEGQKVEGTVTSLSDSGVTIEVNSNIGKKKKKDFPPVKAVAACHHCKNKDIKVGDSIEGRVIFVDYPEDQLHLTLNPRLVEELEGIGGETFVVGKRVRVEILWCNRNVTVGIVKGLVHHGEFVYFPTQCHRNDFFSTPESSTSLKPGEIIKSVIYGKVNGRMIAMVKKYVTLFLKHADKVKIKKRKNEETGKKGKKRIKSDENKTSDVEMIRTVGLAKEMDLTVVKEEVIDYDKSDIEAIKMQIVDDARKSGSDKDREEDLPRLEADQGFIWNADISSLPCFLPVIKDEVDSSSEEEEVKEEPDPRSKKGKKNKELAALRAEEEARVREAEERLMDMDNAPQTADDFDRLVLSSPDSSIIWLKYVAFHLQNTEIEKARAVAQRALKTINFREEQEKLNIWVCLLNLENLYGTKESLEKVLQDALQMNDAFKVYCQMMQIYLDSKKIEELDNLMNVMLKKFRNEKDAWVQAGTICMKSNRPEMAGEILRRSFKSLPERDHVDVICRWAQLEARSECGSVDRAQSLLEGVLASCPRRTDIWSSLTDTLVKAGRIEDARNILERAVSQKISVRKMKVLFKKYLSFEETHGTPENVARVRQLALDYVEKGIAEVS